MICGSCGAFNTPENEFCYSCGQELASRLKVHETVCANHPGRVATGVCSVCGLELCEFCERFVEDTVYCEDCLERPGEAEELEVPDEPITIETFAGMEWRMMAAFLDWVVFWGGAIILDAILVITTKDLLLPFRYGHQWFVAYWLTVATWSTIYMVAPVAVWGQTPGMAAVDLKVVRADGGRVGWLFSVLRFFAFIPSILIIFGIFMPLWDVKRRMWHDKIAQTIVVKLGVMD